LGSDATGRPQPAAGRRYDAIVIGGGVNGLTCAALLGQAGLRTLLLEQRDEVGGCAAEHPLAPGFRVPTLSHRTGPLRADVVEQLNLAQCGLRLTPQPIRYSALAPDGRALPVFADAAAASNAIRGWSPHDAEAWREVTRSLARLGHVIGSLFTRVAPDLDDPGSHDLWTLMRTARAFRALPKDDAWRLLRWGPMAVADLVSECFETELLRAAVAADGLLGAMMGPWSAGSGLQLLMHEANAAVGVTRDADVVGGPSAVAAALRRAAERYGVEVRTGVAVAQVIVRADRAVGVALGSGETVASRAVVSGLDPKRTFLSLCEAEHLPPEFLWRIRNLRVRGTLAKVNLALSDLPAFAGASRQMLASRVRIAPDLEYLERAYDRAKYGECPPHPWIEFAIPSIADPSLAPTGAHVLSAYVQWIPAAGRRQTAGGAPSAEVLETTLATLEGYAPGLRAMVVQAEVITPSDMEQEWGLTGGHIFHGELSLDQAFTMRPLLGWGGYQTPISGLYLCGSGTHPGTGLTGGSGLNAARVIAEALA
jgi:phytoene dehydrogenase-like protein